MNKTESERKFTFLNQVIVLYVYFSFQSRSELRTIRVGAKFRTVTLA